MWLGPPKDIHIEAWLAGARYQPAAMDRRAANEQLMQQMRALAGQAAIERFQLSAKRCAARSGGRGLLAADRAALGRLP